MSDHYTALTYAPKIKGVQDGSITQSIRTKRKYKIGDRICFRGWTGRPYYSPWSFKTPLFPIIGLVDIILFPWGLQNDMPGMQFEKFPWSEMDLLAKRDGIDPATGEELGRVLQRLNKIPAEGIEGQIITWKWIEP